MAEQTFRISRRSFFGGVLALGFVSFAVNPLSAFATPTAAEKQAEAEAALSALKVLQASLDKSSEDYYAALHAQEEAEAKVLEAQARIDAANLKIAELQKDLGTRVSSMYRSGRLTFFDILFGSASFEEFVINWDLLNEMNERDAGMVRETKDLRAEVEQQKRELAEQQEIAAGKTREAESILQEARITMGTMQKTYDSLSVEAAVLLEQERAAREAEERARAQAVIDEAINQARNNSGSGSVPKYESVTGNTVVDRALGCMGLPYDLGTHGPNYFDCSGLVSYALTGSYVHIGSTYTFVTWPQVTDPQPGDIATHRTHCGIYLGGGQMVHASDYGVGVIQGPVQAGMIFVRRP